MWLLANAAVCVWLNVYLCQCLRHWGSPIAGVLIVSYADKTPRYPGKGKTTKAISVFLSILLGMACFLLNVKCSAVTVGYFYPLQGSWFDSHCPHPMWRWPWLRCHRSNFSFTHCICICMLWMEAKLQIYIYRHRNNLQSYNKEFIILVLIHFNKNI